MSSLLNAKIVTKDTSSECCETIADVESSNCHSKVFFKTGILKHYMTVIGPWRMYFLTNMWIFAAQTLWFIWAKQDSSCASYFLVKISWFFVDPLNSIGTDVITKVWVPYSNIFFPSNRRENYWVVYSGYIIFKFYDCLCGRNVFK